MSEKFCSKHDDVVEKLGEIKGSTKIIFYLNIAIFLSIIGLYIAALPAGTFVKQAEGKGEVSHEVQKEANKKRQ